MYVKFNSLSDHEMLEWVNNYLTYYNEERTQEKLGCLTPIEYGVRQPNYGVFISVSYR